MDSGHTWRPRSTFSCRVARPKWSMVAVVGCCHFLSVSSIFLRHRSLAFVASIVHSLPRGSLRSSSNSFHPVSSPLASSIIKQEFGMVESVPSNQQQSEISQLPILAKIVSSSTSLAACGARLREGHLVAFPTETVYGLGCHALDESAISKVFAAKERPLTDPLIVHVTKMEDAMRLWEASSTTDLPEESSSGTVQSQLLRALCDHFWPGPLTIVAKAASHVPPILMANTGFVACRSPSHPIARKLIDEARVPLAAPSANKFGHVSPTRPSHVWDDLLYEDVWVLDAQQDGAESSKQYDSSVVCQVGVESTVAKVEMFDPSSRQSASKIGRLILLRQGAVSVDDVKRCLQNAGLSDSLTVHAQTRRSSNEDIATVAPGQTIRHYSPSIPSFMVAHSSVSDGCHQKWRFVRPQG